MDAHRSKVNRQPTFSLYNLAKQQQYEKLETGGQMNIDKYRVTAHII